MNNLPKDPIMLMSYLNTQLRDNYRNLDELAEGLELSDVELKEIIDKISVIDYHYNESLNQFK